MYDYGARNYVPALGRFMNLDSMAEKRSWLSPYNYVQNNPILKTGPDAMLDGDYYNSRGEYLGNDGINDDKAYYATSRNADGTFNNARELSVSNSTLNQLANTVAIESSGNWKRIFCFGFVNKQYS